MIDPKTPGQWQEAVDSAYGALVLESAKAYGLLTGGPVVNVDRCEKILRRGARRGIYPAPDAIEKFAVELVQPNPS